jgi:hypothetical protein
MLVGCHIAPESTVSPYASAVVFISMLHYASSAFYTYARYNNSDQTGYLLGSIGNAIFASFALWILLFGGEKGHMSKRTGADKRTSGWPFQNAQADKKRL